MSNETPGPGADVAAPTAGTSDPEGLEALIEFLHRARGFDFRGYKRSSVERRLAKRMQIVGVGGYAEYIDFLEVHPDEFAQLFDTMLINVTGFFRDPPAWEALSEHAARLVAARGTTRLLRIWSAGCASGEEACTLAMVFAEALGFESFMRRVKIYATDVDEDALAQARVATYSAKAVEAVPPALLEKYFTRNGGAFVFHKDLRRSMIFGRHDLVQDAPISRVDVLACRNTLMYFNADAQSSVLARLHFALAEDGVLFLGRAEMLLTHAALFTPLDLKLRLFSRVPRSRASTHMLVADPSAAADGANSVDRTKLLEGAFDTSPVAQIVLDGTGRIVLINRRAATVFSLTAYDVGRPFHDLELSYRPAELRSCIGQVRADGAPIYLREVERTSPNGEKAYFDIEVAPLGLEQSTVSGIYLAFTEITHFQKLQGELRRANLELATAHEELQSTSEELETTNEELQSTVEELETTNEELQSTNEELETMNEELQSTNEELQTMNEELRQRGDDLNQVNAFFGAILASLRGGVVVLDQDIVVKAWNPKMEDLWGLRTEEVLRQHFFNLDIGLPVEHLRGPIRTCLASDEELEKIVDATNRRGKSLRCRVTITPLRGAPNRGVILLLEEIPAG